MAWPPVRFIELELRYLSYRIVLTNQNLMVITLRESHASVLHALSLNIVRNLFRQQDSLSDFFLIKI